MPPVQVLGLVGTEASSKGVKLCTFRDSGATQLGPGMLIQVQGWFQQYRQQTATSISDAAALVIANPSPPPRGELSLLTRGDLFS